MRRIFYFFLFFVIFLPSCSTNEEKDKKKIITAEMLPFHNVLVYSGMVQPIKTFVVASPADGIVIDMPFQYGEMINTGQLLFVLSSSKFLTDYKNAITQYVKAKNEFNTSKSQLSEAEFLHKNLLISDDDFKMKQSNFFSNRLALLQAKDALEVLANQGAIKEVDFSQLSLADFDKVIQAMHLKAQSENLRIFAAESGLILFASKGEEESKKILKGSVVKQGDVLAMLGDMSGIVVQIKVNELTVNQLKLKQKVKVTGIAFPDDVLIGEIKRVDHQGEGSNGSLPLFSVEIVVPHLTYDQQKKIHVGMSAKVEIDIQEEPHILLPLNAVKEKLGEAIVKVYDDKTKKIHETSIKTGATTSDSVIVLSGLNKGDKIVITD